jgi:hypothetical protein
MVFVNSEKHFSSRGRTYKKLVTVAASRKGDESRAQPWSVGSACVRSWAPAPVPKTPKKTKNKGRKKKGKLLITIHPSEFYTCQPILYSHILITHTHTQCRLYLE